MKKILLFLALVLTLSAFGQGTTYNVKLGESFSAFQCAYLSSDGKVYKADPTNPTKAAVGMILTGGVVNDVSQMQINGTVKVPGASLIEGAQYYMGGPTIGSITATRPTIEQKVGIALGTDIFSIAIAPISYNRPYRVYIAKIVQSGTSDPVATVLENTIGQTVTWTRSETGIYVASTSNGWNGNNLFQGFTFWSAGNSRQQIFNRIDDDSDDQQFSSISLSADLMDVEGTIYVEIRVY